MDTLSKKWITVPEAARIIGCHDSYVRRLIRQNAIPVLVFSPRVRLVDRNSLTQFSKENKGFWKPGLKYPKKSEK